METLEVLKARREREYWAYRIRSLEAKLEKIEPESQEFEDTVAAIFEAEDNVAKAHHKHLALHWAATNRELQARNQG